jgi:hypothetical protein
MTHYDNIPNDPVMLLSFVNTQLRDNFSTFDDFCASYQVDKEEIAACLAGIDYTYNADLNRFV